MNTYLVLKHIHVGSVGLSLAIFLARVGGRLAGSQWIAKRSVRIARNAVDAVLLVSAIALAVVIGVSPLSTPWLAAKIVALVIYMVLGVVAMRLARTPLPRVAAALAALLVFGYIVGVAITKDAGWILGAATAG